MRAFRASAALLLALAGLALVIAGCSSGGGPIGSSSGGGSKTYTNDQYEFTLTYDNQFGEGEQVTVAGAVFGVVFPDKQGTIVSNRYVDAIEILVHELAREVKPTEVPQLKAEVQNVVNELLASTSAAQVVDPLSEVTVNGVPGFRVGYTYTKGGTELTATTLFLLKGKYEYEITAQAASGRWDALKGDLEAAVQSFRVR